MNRLESFRSQKSPISVEATNKARRMYFETKIRAIQIALNHPDSPELFLSDIQEWAEKIRKGEIKLKDITPEMMGLDPLPETNTGISE